MESHRRAPMPWCWPAPIRSTRSATPTASGPLCIGAAARGPRVGRVLGDVRARHRGRRRTCATWSRARSCASPPRACVREQGRACRAARASCIFEYVYFARPDSVHRRADRSTRRAAAMGRILARGGARGGRPRAGRARLGRARRRSAIRARAAGIPFADGIVKNRYVGRTFIQPTQAMRQLGIRLKLNPLPCGHRRQAARGHRRLHRAWQHVEEARADAARCRRGRGAPAHREPRGANGPASTASTPTRATSSSPRT